MSVVVPTHARPECLKACIEAIDRLEYPRDRFEIVVVDDGSPVPVDTPRGSSREPRLRVVRQDRSGPAAARNAGTRIAEGEIVAFLDDDCAPDERWLHLLVRHLADERTIAGGRTVNALLDNAYSEASQALITYLYEYYSSRRPELMFFTTNNLALRRSDLLELGGFDRRFRRAAGEDREFSVRSTRAGFQLIYDADAVVRHAHHLTMRSFWRQHFAYGCAAHTFHSESPLGPRTLEPLAFYTRLAFFPRATGMRKSNRVGMLLAVSQLANALGYLSRAIQHNRPG